MMLHDSNEEKITQGSIRWANPGYRALRFWAKILWLHDVREGACLCCIRKLYKWEGGYKND